jgi:hypothetical protein
VAGIADTREMEGHGRAVPRAISRGLGIWPHALALLGLPLAAHLTFSSLGFNPTDDGFILAYSRRLLDGQVPHRDFISIRPVGSALLHAPWLLFGSHAFWVARLAVWFEVALIAWAWTRVVGQATGRPSGSREIVLGTLIAFVMTSFTFPVMPWHTLDAVALASVGLLLGSSASGVRRALGYGLLGASALCRQNFLPVAPLAALVMGHRRDRGVGIAAIAPLALYGGYLVSTGALVPAWEQMKSQAGLEATGVRAYLAGPVAWGLIAGAVSALLQEAWPGRDAAAARWRPLLGSLLPWGLVFGAASTMMSATGEYIHVASFLLFGAALGRTLVVTARHGPAHPSSRIGWLALVVAWCASLSIGLNSPALAAGLLATVLLAPAWDFGITWSTRARAATRLAAAAGVAAAFVVVWGTARQCVIYRDGPATELTQPLDRVLPGGAGLRTNPQTFALMSDLALAVDRTRGTHAVVADFPAYWVRAAQRNPVSIDWAQSTELNTPALKARVIGDLEALRGHGCIVAQKVAAGPFAESATPVAADDSYYFVLSYVRTHFRRTGGTRWFDVYE